MDFFRKTENKIEQMNTPFVNQSFPFLHAFFDSFEEISIQSICQCKSTFQRTPVLVNMYIGIIHSLIDILNDISAVTKFFTCPELLKYIMS